MLLQPIITNGNCLICKQNNRSLQYPRKMFLMDFIDPIIVNNFPEKEEINVDNGFDLKNAPCLLTHLDKKSFVIPKDWTGCLFGSENWISKLQATSNFGIISNVRHLIPDEPTTVKLSDSNTIEVTMFSTDQANDFSSMLFIQDMYINCLYTACLGDFVAEIVCNSLLQKTIGNGIDILYIDDTIFGSEKNIDALHPTEYQLSSLVYLVRPKEVEGIFGKEIPLYIKEFCQKRDYFMQIL